MSILVAGLTLIVACGSTSPGLEATRSQEATFDSEVPDTDPTGTDPSGTDPTGTDPGDTVPPDTDPGTPGTL